MQSKQTCCASIAARLHGGEHAAVGYTTVLEVAFISENFADGSERKGLSALTGKFPSSAAGLHLVLKTSYLRKNHV